MTPFLDDEHLFPVVSISVFTYERGISFAKLVYDSVN